MNLPPVIEYKREEKREEEKHDKFIICISRTLTEEEKKLLSEYGIVKDYDNDLYNNIQLEDINFDYLIVDLRKKVDRYYFMKYILVKKDLYKVILYQYAFEDKSIECDNVITSFPQRQATRLIFNQLLLLGRIKEPRAWLSFLKCCLGVYKDLK